MRQRSEQLRGIWSPTLAYSYLLTNAEYPANPLVPPASTSSVPNPTSTPPITGIITTTATALPGTTTTSGPVLPPGGGGPGNEPAQRDHGCHRAGECRRRVLSLLFLEWSALRDPGAASVQRGARCCCGYVAAPPPPPPPRSVPEMLNKPLTLHSRHAGHSEAPGQCRYGEARRHHARLEPSWRPSRPGCPTRSPPVPCLSRSESRWRRPAPSRRRKTSRRPAPHHRRRARQAPLLLRLCLPTWSR